MFFTSELFCFIHVSCLNNCLVLFIQQLYLPNYEQRFSQVGSRKYKCMFYAQHYV